MKRFLVTGIALLAAAQLHAAETPDTKAVVAELMNKYAQTSGLAANLEIRYQTGQEESVATSTLAVSRKYGWKLEDFTPGREHRIVNDFTVMYQYFPREARVLKMVADEPGMAAAFRKPAEELNPLSSLDPTSVKLIGQEMLNSEPTYHFAGTTQTQMLEMGQPAMRAMEVWLGTNDGLPRKTVEKSGDVVMTTVYRDVKVNPDFKAEDFRFSAPAGVEVLDMNEQISAASRSEAAPTTAPAKNAP
ncbi:hypothetical protein CVU37_07870 [candidate division BRC1 bacterium HGW-BRC1-1]|nr:MAG: hypothetical protein CVU37_07870 [candidate division BRC1 bacterium HGW-BRC1-1]